MGVGASPCERSRELALGGGDDGNIAAPVATGNVGGDGEREGASGADVGIGDTIDGTVGGVIVGAADDAGGRHAFQEFMAGKNQVAGAVVPWMPQGADAPAKRRRTRRPVACPVAGNRP